MKEDVTFPSGQETCAAWLYKPPGGEPHPVIVMAHGLGAVKEMRLDAFAERFQAAGYACLVFDYRHFGASTGEPRQLLDIARQRADWAAALAYVRGREDLDRSRIVLWGTSFGGGHALATAAADHDVAAAIAQCPFTDGLASVLAMSPRVSLKVTARGLADVVRSRLRGRPVLVPTAGPPGTTALMAAPDALPGMQSIAADDAAWRNEVCARIALQISLDAPGRKVKRIDCPVLFCVCEPDTVAPAKATLRHATKARRGEVRLYPDGHFDIYLGEPFERVVADQLAFLSRHVPTT
jgi:pimeloyl-ACP methyl ester carboxylesterase